MAFSIRKINQKQISAAPLSLRNERRKMMIVLALAIAVTNTAMLVLPTAELRATYGNISASVTAGAVVVIGALIVRQGVKGLFGRAYAALTAGITMWTIAEIIWAYNALVLGISVPFPSIADALWLAGYAPLAFHMFSTSSAIYGVNVKKKATFIVSLSVAAFSGFYIAGLVSASELTGPSAAESITISILYPVLDAIIVVPAVLSVLNSGRGELTAIPWILIAWILTVLADGMFGYSIVTNTSENLQILSDSIYNSAYLFMAAGVFWHYRYFVVSSKKLDEAWLKAHK